jgi:leucyl-tRNA synthetase
MYRFIKRVWVMGTGKKITSTPLSPSANTLLHKTIKGVTDDLGSFRYNTAIAKIMTLYNCLSQERDIQKESLLIFLQLLAPFAPHMAEELWEMHGGKYSIHTSSWPEYDEEELVEEELTIVVQINGRLRDSLRISKGSINDQNSIERLARESKAISRHLEGKEIKKVIYVNGKVLNFVVL